MNELKATRKSILVGGVASGVISLIPIINLINILFMMWMGVGGFISVYLLKKENHIIKTSDAALIGAMSGITGGIIFGFFTSLAVLNISEEKIEKMISLAGSFPSILGEDLNIFFQSSNLKVLFLIVIAITLLFSILSGTIGGLISKGIFFKKVTEK